MRRDEQPGLPDDVWQRFLHDSEAAIRRTAPREPSARERATMPGTAVAPSAAGGDAIGELWHPRPERERAAWRDLDGRGRLGRTARALGAVAVFVAVLATVSHLPNAPAPQADRPGVVLQESEPAPTERPTAEASPSPAAFSPPGIAEASTEQSTPLP
ncbi:hypothetical protein RCO28_10625 [Streptomyces sp. LHD-70]|uniref:hypothetical protein n=1 Tax=Streptomyces sp. LHD-70 TaxID=3072140 RepID=UPI00280CC287|nr:hypothetical protein [Streptomyces sp. LHD-70]MDQ8702939.1 hypothetical protein [Streptomyces sp. LHD-70]